MAVSSSGVTVTSTKGDLIGGFGVDIRAGKNGLIYSTNGRVVNPETQALVGTFSGIDFSALVAPDSTAGRVYFLTGGGSGGTNATVTLLAFDQNTFTPVGSLAITGVSGTPSSLVRWGANGLAFRTNNNQVYLIQTSLVPSSEPVPSPTPTPSGSPTPTPTPIPPAAFIQRIPLPTKDIVYDAATATIYASVPSSAGATGNSITAINPATATVESSVFVGSEPGKLALSQDGRDLYVALDGAASVRRFNTVSRTPGTQFRLGGTSFDGPFYAKDIAILPGSPETVAVSRRGLGYSPDFEGVAIYDNGVQRPTTTADHTGSDFIEASDSASTIYGNGGYGFQRLTVTSSGITVASSHQVAGGFGDIEFEDGLIYMPSGRVVNAETGALVGTFSDVGFDARAVLPDSTTGRVYFLIGGSMGGSTVTVRAYDKNTFVQLGSINISGVPGTASSLVRWGANGLAFRTAGNQLFLVRTALVPSNEPVPTPTPTPSPSPTPSPTPFAADVRQVALETKDIIYDRNTSTIFASVPSNVGATGNSITAINPATGTVGSSVFIGSEPGKLAISDNGQYLYAALNGAASVRRFDIATRTAGLQFTHNLSNFGGSTVTDLAVAPGSPETVAVSKGAVGIFDNGVLRQNVASYPSSNVIEYSASATTLYGYNNYSSAFDFNKITVDASGATVAASGKVFSGYSNDMKFDNGLIYAASGEVVDPEARTILGTFRAPEEFGGTRLVTPDSALGRTFMLVASGSSTTPTVIYAFDTRTFLPIGSISIPGVTGKPDSLVRWGENGLAFRTAREPFSSSGGNQVYLIRSALVSSSGPLPTPTPTPTPTPPSLIVSGQVKDVGGTGIAGVTITAATGQTGATEARAAQTDAGGNYSVSAVPGTRVTISASKVGYSFDPQSVSFVSTSTAVTGTRTANFTAFPPPATDRKIAFASNRFSNGAAPDIVTADDNGANPQRLTTDPAADVYPAWSPDGARIAFSSNRNGVYDIYVMNADGTNQIRLTSGPTDNYEPEWSPDGTKILFMRRISGNNYDIYVMDADGSNQKLLVSSPAFDGSPVWSPDGTKIAFDTNRDGNYEVYTADADGTAIRRLTNDPADDGDAAWSPDNSKIAFTSNRGTGTYGIYVMNTDGSAPTRLTTGQASNTRPSWSADSSMIAFESNRSGNPDVFVMNADGSGERNITNIANPTNPSTPPAADITPAWQPMAGLPVRAEIRTWTLNGRTSAFVKLTFPNNRYRVNPNAWGAVARNGNDFVVTANVEETTGGTLVRLPTATAHIYELGALETGDYRFTFNSNASATQTKSFRVATVATGTNPIDDAREFVRQHYRDFLGRDPDEPGLNFWTNEITSCGTDAQCIDRKRVNTSGSFFLSQEFQATGYYVYRLYKGALNRPPYYAEFLPDVRQVAQGIVVDDKLSPEVIDRNRQTLARLFVERPDVVSIYAQLSDAQFVDRLFQNTGVQPNEQERLALVAELGSGTGTISQRRASVLHKIIDGTRTVRSATNPVDVTPIFETRYGRAFYDQQYNRAFVHMQYFGYLRRDPDPEGYQFWLDKLNLYGNFTDAEMVRSFILAAEYRSRFGQP